LDEPEDDQIMLHQQQAPPINWEELILNLSSSNNNNKYTAPELKEQVERELLKSCSFSSAESTTLSEDEMSSLHSVIEQTEGFESGFETFDDFLTFSTSNLDDLMEEEQGTTIGEVKTKSKSKLKRKLKKLKTKLKNSVNVKQIKKNSGAILRAVSNATALVFRGALFMTVNVLIVLTIILSLAIV
jgi:hypothetical protein